MIQKMKNLLVSIAEVRLSECVFARTLLFLDSFVNEDRTNRVSFCLRPVNECQLARGYCSQSLLLCDKGFIACPELEGCPDLYKCCW